MPSANIIQLEPSAEATADRDGQVTRLSIKREMREGVMVGVVKTFRGRHHNADEEAEFCYVENLLSVVRLRLKALGMMELEHVPDREEVENRVLRAFAWGLGIGVGLSILVDILF